jgi:hypothetical protein
MTASRFRFSNLARGPWAWALLAALSGMHARADDALPNCPVPEVKPFPGPPPNNVRVVKGVPYSALGTSETVTTLADGNRIVRQNRIRLWRDSDGRTRSEFSLSSIGGPLPLELNTTVTVIDDPATRERYMLQRSEKIAVTMPIVPCRADSAASEPDLTVGPPRPPGFGMKMSAPVKLGERTLNGEKLAGSRIEGTIPAGAIGNEQPIRMSAEQWYGKDLQVVVEATYQDPRSGETKYKLSEIRRDEPDAKLFRVPDDYTRQPRLRSPR